MDFMFLHILLLHLIRLNQVCKLYTCLHFSQFPCLDIVVLYVYSPLDLSYCEMLTEIMIKMKEKK